MIRTIAGTAAWRVQQTTQDIEALRERQIRNFFTILMMSQGRPMFLMGDEVRNTQQGNNNAYSQDNEISWFDWAYVEEHGDLLRFVSGLLRFRQGSQLFRDRRYRLEPGGTDVIWHGVRVNEPDWGDNSHSLAFELLNPTDPTIDDHVYVILNAYWEPLEFELPGLSQGRCWERLVDTGRQPPEDFAIYRCCCRTVSVRMSRYHVHL